MADLSSFCRDVYPTLHKRACAMWLTFSLSYNRTYKFYIYACLQQSSNYMLGGQAEFPPFLSFFFFFFFPATLYFIFTVTKVKRNYNLQKLLKITI